MILLLLLSSIAHGEIEPIPIEKIGPCPTNYQSSILYCMPMVNAKFAIVKNGLCPENYTASSKYCLAEKNARRAIHKTGNCPIGYTPSSNYCLQSVL